MTCSRPQLKTPLTRIESGTLNPKCDALQTAPVGSIASCIDSKNQFCSLNLEIWQAHEKKGHVTKRQNCDRASFVGGASFVGELCSEKSG